MARYIGIDLGTTNSTVSVSNKTIHGDIEATTLRITQVDDSGHGIIEDEALPSVLYVEEGGTSYVGRYAKRMNSTYTKRVIKEAKRHIGTTAKWEIDGEHYHADKVASFVLDILKRQAEQHYNGETIDGAVITIPANFHFQQQQATKNAGVLAGFKKENIHMIPEPTAALLDYLNDEKKLESSARRLNLTTGPKNLMVFDLGGGTCDVSILQVQEDTDGSMSIQELSISQYMELGGRDFDKKIMMTLLGKYLAEIGETQQSLRAKYKLDVIHNLGECLLDIAERTKKSFSAKVLTAQRDYYEDPQFFDKLFYQEMLPGHLPSELIKVIRMTKKEYDEAIKSLLHAEFDTHNKNIEFPILNALADAAIGPMTTEQIDGVFLVGGMTYYPTVKNRVYEIFKRRIKPMQSINPMISVSRGAAIYHQQLDKYRYRGVDEIDSASVATGGMTTLGNTVPNNIYIEVAGADPIALLEKGTKLPFERTITDKFYVSGVNNDNADITTMMLELFTATSAKAIRSTKLSQARIEFKKQVKRNSKLVLKVVCDEERDVTISAWLEHDPSERLEVHIGANDYTEEEVRRLQQQHAKTNVLSTPTI